MTIACCLLPIHAKTNKIPKKCQNCLLTKFLKINTYASKTQPKAILLKNRTFWLEKIT